MENKNKKRLIKHWLSLLDCFEEYKPTNSKENSTKWIPDKELSSIDRAIIFELLANKQLLQCVLACDAKNKS